MLLVVIFILCSLHIGAGFLLDKNPQGSVGTVTSNNQYVAASEFYEEKKEQRHMTTELRHDTEQLRNDMEKTFAFMTSQFQKQLAILEQKIESDGCSLNDTSQNINNLEQKYNNLGQNYRDLETNNTKLRNEFTDLLTKYTKQEQELSELKQLKNLQPLQDLNHIKQQLHTVASQTHSLSVNERARSQDFLALYNKTVNIEEMTNHRIGKYQNMTNTKFHQLESNQNTTHNTLNQKIMDLKQHSEIIENDTLLNVNKEFQNIQKNLSISLADLELHIKDNSRKVAVTSCVSSQKTYSTHELVKFDDLRTSVGIKNLSAFKTSGKFSCEVKGLYQLSVHIASSTQSSTYSIYKNSNKLITTYTMSYGYATTSTGVAVVEVDVGDTISVTPDTSMYIYAEHWSCITIAMLK